MTNKRLFKKEYAKELLTVAESDLETAIVLAKAKLPRKENTLFHVQQALEKALKAQICFMGQPVPLVHDLSELLREIPQGNLIPHNESLYDLTQFATIRRYEEGVAIIEDGEIDSAINAAREVLDWVRKSVSE